MRFASMHRLTVGFDDDQLDWIEERADAEDRSHAEIVRRAVDAVRTDAMRTDADRTGAMHDDADHTEVHHDDFDDLRERVAALEDQLTADDQPGGSADRSSPPDPRGSAGETLPADMVSWARTREPVSRREILAWVEPQIDIKPDSWWKRHGRDALKAAGAEFTRNRGWEFAEGQN